VKRGFYTATREPGTGAACRSMVSRQHRSGQQRGPRGADRDLARLAGLLLRSRLRLLLLRLHALLVVLARVVALAHRSSLQKSEGIRAGIVRQREHYIEAQPDRPRHVSGRNTKSGRPLGAAMRGITSGRLAGACGPARWPAIPMGELAPCRPTRPVLPPEPRAPPSPAPGSCRSGRSARPARL